MNKKFTEMFSGYGMEIHGNSAYGIIRGYETNVEIQILDTQAPVAVYASCYTTSEQKKAIEQALRTAGIKFFKFAFSDYGITLGFNDLTLNRLIKRLPDLLTQCYGILSSNGALESKYCPVCGNELNPENRKKAIVGDFAIYLDQDCIANLNNVISEENKEYADAPNNYLNGFFGALLGGVIGGILGIVLYMAGYISAFSALVAILTGSFFYKKFGGKQDKIMVLILACTTLVCMAGSVVLIYAFTAFGFALEYYPTITMTEAFLAYMQDPEFSQYFFSDLGMTVFFSLLGVGYEISKLYKSVKRKKQIL